MQLPAKNAPMRIDCSDRFLSAMFLVAVAIIPSVFLGYCRMIEKHCSPIIANTTKIPGCSGDFLYCDNSTPILRAEAVMFGTVIAAALIGALAAKPIKFLYLNAAALFKKCLLRDNRPTNERTRLVVNTY